MQKFESTHEHEGAPTDEPTVDLTEDEARRLGEALVEIVETIHDTVGYFQKRITHETFFEKFDQDVEEFRAEGEDQPFRETILHAWEHVAQAVGMIYALVTINREGAKDAIREVHPDKDVTDQYLTDSLNAIADKLDAATKLAREVSEARGEAGL